MASYQNLFTTVQVHAPSYPGVGLGADEHERTRDMAHQGGASVEQVAVFLHDWRFHRLGMLQSAYHALHDLIIGSWYADPSSWAASGGADAVRDPGDSHQTGHAATSPRADASTSCSTSGRSTRPPAR